MEQNQIADTQQTQSGSSAEAVVAQPIQNHNKYKIIILVSICLFVSLILGFLIYLKVSSKDSSNLKQSESINDPTKIAEENSPAQNTGIDKLTTFKSSKHSFSVQYAQGFNIKEVVSQYDDTLSVIVYDYLLPPSEANFEYEYNTSITIAVGDKNFKRSDFYYGGFEWTKSIVELLMFEANGTQKNHEYDVIAKTQDVEVGGFKGMKFTATTKSGTGTEGSPGDSRAIIALMLDTKTFFIEGTDELISNSVVDSNGSLVFKDMSDKTIFVFKPGN